MTKSSVEEKSKRPESSEELENSINTEALVTSVQELDSRRPKTFDSAYALFEELKRMPAIEPGEIELFFDAVKSKVEDNWVQFLTKVSLNLNPAKNGKDRPFVDCIEKECFLIAEKNNIAYNNIKQAEEDFFKKKDGSIISELLSEMLNSGDNSSTQRIVIASLVFIPFSMECRQRGYGNYQTQIIIDRTVTEFLVENSMHEKENAGKTLGTLLSARTVSTKKISELAFLYSGTTGKINELESQVTNLRETNEKLKEDYSFIKNKNKAREQENAECRQKIAELEAETENMLRSRNDARAMLDFETHKFENLLKTREEGIAERYYSSISLELEAIKELCNYIGENDQKRILRRLDRISSILLRNKGN